MLAMFLVVLGMILWWYISVKYDVLNTVLGVLYKIIDRFK
jgi:hypothetical protein